MTLLSTTGITAGDHKQLRPKVEYHDLTVVADLGHDLDRSLFERLVIDRLVPSHFPFNPARCLTT
jgi:superfamily I DNA and/or RNA helicase